MTTQRRAKAGGEEGVNGEWYEGGKFIATTDHEKRHGSRPKGTGRQEIEPYVWDSPPEPGMRSLFRFMGQGVFVMRGADGQLQLNDNDVTWMYYWKTPEAVAQAKIEYQGYIDRYVAGKRWIMPAPVTVSQAEPPAMAAEASLGDNESPPEPKTRSDPRYRP